MRRASAHSWMGPEAGESEDLKSDDFGGEMASPIPDARALRRSKKADTCSRGPTAAMSSTYAETVRSPRS
jgi:hypothetical protein